MDICIDFDVEVDVYVHNDVDIGFLKRSASRNVSRRLMQKWRNQSVKSYDVYTSSPRNLQL